MNPSQLPKESGSSKESKEYDKKRMMTYGKFSGPNQSTQEDFKIAEYKEIN